MVFIPKGPQRTFSGGSAVFLPTGTKTTGAVRHYNKGWMNSVNSPGPPYTQMNNWEQVWCYGKPGRINGTEKINSTQSYVYTDWAADTAVDSSTTATATYNPLPAQINPSELVNRAMLNVDFTKPPILLPSFAWELREFPKMLMQLGNVLAGRIKASDVAGGYLAWEFGWAPLIRDLQTLVDLGDKISDAQQRFLQAKKSLKLSGSLGTVTRNGRTSHDLAGRYTHRREWEGKTKLWFTAHWDILQGTPDLLFGTRFEQFRWATGLNRPVASFWAALPWSWLIDYFTNISTLIELSDGYAEFRPSKICIMVQDRLECIRDEVSWITSFSGSYDPLTYTWESKRRTVYAHPVPRPIFRPFGFLNHMDIMSSLVTSRALKSQRL